MKRVIVGLAATAAMMGSFAAPVQAAPAGTASFDKTSLAFGDWHTFSISDPLTIKITNSGGSPLTMTGYDIVDPSTSQPTDNFFYDEDSPCFDAALAVGQSCNVDFYFNPDASTSSFSAGAALQSDGTPPSAIGLTGRGTDGYVIATAGGESYSYGDAEDYDDLGSLNKPIVGVTPTPDGYGIWRVAGDGGIFAQGNAGFYGSTGNIKLNQPVVGMAPTSSGNGYWMVASDGGIFAYGDAQFYGSTGSIKLNKPIVGMFPTPSNRGYWLVASDGGIFAYGDAQFFGSTGSITLNKPIVGMSSTLSGNGYWMVASDGGIFAYGDAKFYGSAGSIKLKYPVVGMAGSPSGKGYRLVTEDGGIFAYGDSSFLGSAGSEGLDDVVGLATSANYY